MSNRSVTYTLNLNSNVRQAIIQHEQAALRLDGVMHSLNNTMRMFGLGFAGHAIANAAKEWVDSAATYEDAVNRIRFASDNLKEGASNVDFIRNAVDRFKIPLQEATDDYGAFLAMVQGSGMAIETVQKLHDNILMIGKIKHLDAGQLSAGVMNLGKMLEAGAMDARHLRPLEMQLSGIGKFIADEMGVSIHELAKLRNKGKLTDIDPTVLLHAIEKQAASLNQHLPEALESTRSVLNDLSNDWLQFKNDVVLDLKPELIELFATFKDGVAWMQENREELIRVGGAVLHIAEAYVAYKSAMFVMNGINTIFGVNQARQIAQTAKVTSSTNLETSAIQRLVVVLEELAAAQSHVAVTANSMINAQANARISSMGVGYMAMNQIRATAAAGIHAQAAAIGAAAGRVNSAAAAGVMGGIMKGATKVFIVGMAAQVANDLFGPQRHKEFGGGSPSILDYVLKPFSTAKEFTAQDLAHQRLQFELNQLANINSLNSALDPLNIFGEDDKKLKEDGNEFLKALMVSSEDVSTFLKSKGDEAFDPKLIDKINPLNEYGERTYKTNLEMLQALRELKFEIPVFLDDGSSKSEWAGFPFASGTTKKALDEKEKKDFKIGAGLDNHKSIRGNSVTNVNITITEMNGINKSTFEVKNMTDMKDIEDKVGTILTRKLTQVVNDSQIVGQH